MAEQKNAPFFVDKEVIILSKNGLWLSDGQEITHEATRKIFSTNLKKRCERLFHSDSVRNEVHPSRGHGLFCYARGRGSRGRVLSFR